MQALQLHAFGDPAAGVRLVDLPDPGAPAPDEVVIATAASPINNTDQLIIAGRYGYLPPLPSVLGVEGVGRVVAAGRDVKHLKEGDLTLVPVMAPAWAQRVSVRAEWLRPLPEGDVDQLSMLGINVATAYLLLTDLVPLKKGDWIVQNGANSPTGRAVIAIARSLGVRTVNVVRRPELVDEVRALGGDVVLVDGTDLPKRVAAELGTAKIGYALDMVADASTGNLQNSLAPGGQLISYSVASGKPLAASGLQLIFNNQSIRGFWLVRWFETAPPQKVAAMYERLAPMVASGEISAPIAATYPLEKFEEALAAAGRRRGKVIFRPN